jgi:tRNA-specific 2-thiouridylase
VRLKFGALLGTALALGADYLATGHYARVERDPVTLRTILRKGLDESQDQSYFLYALSPEALAHARFPLGHLEKRQVRQIAESWGLHVSDKPSSQDICFVRGADYREFLIQRCPEAFRPGPIVDSSGAVLGTHRGIGNYTLGQRKGLGIAASQRLYVVGLDAPTNTVIVGTEEEITVRSLAVGSLNWIAGDPPVMPIQLSVRTRYRGPETPADVLPERDHALVNFSRPHPIAAPGQAAVFYCRDRLVGGGTIQ